MVNKYAVLIKHFARGIEDTRIELVSVPSEIENVGPSDVEAFVRNKLLGPFEVICVTDRIANDVYVNPAPRKEDDHDA